MALDFSESVPTETLNDRIFNDLEGQILSGALPPGSRIPFEVDLAESYGCSRMTVNKALARLVDAGLIERRRKSGSFVRQPRAQSAILEIHDIQSEVLSMGLAYAYQLQSCVKRKATAQDRTTLGLESAAPLLSIRALHHAGSRVFCLEERLINLDAVPEAETVSFADIPPSPWLVKQVPWSSAEHVIRAVAADALTAQALAVAPGTACLVIERRTVWNEAPITAVRLTYPGDLHAMVASFTPSVGR